MCRKCFLWLTRPENYITHLSPTIPLQPVFQSPVLRAQIPKLAGIGRYRELMLMHGLLYFSRCYGILLEVFFLKRDIFINHNVSFVEPAWPIWLPLSVREHLDIQNKIQDELYRKATMGQHDKQFITELHCLWRKRSRPPVPSTFWEPGNPQEEILHGYATGLGPWPGQPQLRA